MKTEIEKMMLRMEKQMKEQERQIKRQNQLIKQQEIQNKKMVKETKKLKRQRKREVIKAKKQAFRATMKEMNKKIRVQNQKVKYSFDKTKKRADIVRPIEFKSAVTIYLYEKKQTENALVDGILQVLMRTKNYNFRDPNTYANSADGTTYFRCYTFIDIVPNRLINKFQSFNFYNIVDDGQELVWEFYQELMKINEYFKDFLDQYTVSKELPGFKIISRAPHNIQYVAPNVANMRVMDDGTNKFINSYYTKYKLNLQASEFKDMIQHDYIEYVQTNYRPKSCLLTAIINKFYNRFNTIKSDGKRNYKELTYTYLCEILGIPDKPSFNAVSLNEVRDKFFKRFSFTGIRAYDVYMNLIYSHEPTDLTHSLILKVMYKDKHVYELNDNLKSLEQKVNMEDDERKQLTVSDKYNILGEDKKEEKDDNIREKDIYCDNFDYLFTEIKSGCTDENLEKLKIIYADDLIPVLFKFIETGYSPKVAFAGHIYRISLQIGKLNIVLLPANNDPNKGQLINYDSLEEYNKYTKTFDNFYNNIVKKEYLSDINPSVMEIEDHYTIKPILGYFDNYEPKPFNTIDENKAYTECLSQIKEVPLFNYFDIYKTYTNEAIEDLTYYIIEVLEKSKRAVILFGSKFSRTYGYILKQTNIKYRVLYYRTPLAIEEVNFKNAVDELYKESIKPDMKKSIANITMGLLEKKENKAELSKIFDDYNEANYYCIKYEGKILPLIHDEFESKNVYSEFDKCFTEEINIVSSKQIYLVAVNEKKRLTNGFTPIKDMIYLNQRLKILKQYDSLIKLGVTVRGIKTDCLMYEGSDKVITDNFKLSSNIGEFKIEKDKYLLNTPLILIENELKQINQYKSILKTFEDELDTAHINKYMEEPKAILIKGLYPGVGKSTLCKNNDKKCLFVCPYNKLCQVLRTEDYDSITYSKLFGLVGTDQEFKHIKKYDLSEYNTIVFDEIFLYEPRRLKRVAELMQEHPEKKFLATGDCDQRDPIAFKNSDYLSQCMNVLFPNHILLQDIKRFKQQSDKDKLIELKKDIFNMSMSIEDICTKHNLNIVRKLDDVKSSINVCLFNFRCDMVNNHVHKNILKHQEQYLNGMNIICKKYEKNKKFTINTNYTYKIVKYGKKETKLIDEVENLEFVVPNGILLNNFKLPYALTCDSVQGLSFGENDKVTVFDSNTPYVDRKYFWTAITRARKLENVSVFIHSENEVARLCQSRLKLYFNFKVESYKRQDNKANRPFTKEEFINDDWICEKVNNCRNYCQFCKKHMELRIDDNGNVISNITVDRIDNSKAHTKDNSQICCLKCNRIKGNRY